MLLMALETMRAFYFFFHLQGAIHRQGYAPVISLRQQWLPDTSAPCKRCAISRSPVDEAACMKRVDGPTRTCTNLICPVNQIPSFCFSDGRSRRASAAGWNLHWQSNQHFRWFWGHPPPPPPLPLLTNTSFWEGGQISITLQAPPELY